MAGKPRKKSSPHNVKTADDHSIIGFSIHSMAKKGLDKLTDELLKVKGTAPQTPKPNPEPTLALEKSLMHVSTKDLINELYNRAVGLALVMMTISPSNDDHWHICFRGSVPVTQAVMYVARTEAETHASKQLNPER